jgi:hypothetical protein
MGVIREPVAVLLGLLAFACAAGAAWQAGLAWPASSKRPLARIGAASALVLAALGFSLGYWEVLSGVGDLFFSFGPPFVRVLFDVAAIGLPLAVVGLLLGVVSMLHAADVPPRAIGSGILAGLAIGWLLDPYGTLGGRRMATVRDKYLAASAADPSNIGSTPLSETSSTGWWDSLSSFGDHDSDGDANPLAVAIALIALAVLALGGGIVTAALVFREGRKKAQSQLAQASAATEFDRHESI